MGKKHKRIKRETLISYLMIARNDTDADFYFHTDRVCILYKPV